MSLVQILSYSLHLFYPFTYIAVLVAHRL